MIKEKAEKPNLVRFTIGVILAIPGGYFSISLLYSLLGQGFLNNFVLFLGLMGIPLLIVGLYLTYTSDIRAYYKKSEFRNQINYLLDVFLTHQPEIDDFIETYTKDQEKIYDKENIKLIYEKFVTYLESSCQLNEELFNQPTVLRELCNYLAQLEIIVDMKSFFHGIAGLLNSTEKEKFLGSMNALWYI